MYDYPFVLVKSYGSTTPLSFIENIITKCGGNIIKEDFSIDSKIFEFYLCNIKTKYFENKIALLPYDGNISVIPSDILANTESIIVFFDAKKKAFLEDLSGLCNLIRDNNIRLGILLTSKLYDDTESGITHKEVQDICNFQFQLIELCDCDENRSDDLTSNELYEEVFQALHNYVWSNAKYSTSKSSESSDLTPNAESVEEQLEAFEKLLTCIQHFKTVSATLEREEVLNEAEKLADLFASMVNED